VSVPSSARPARGPVTRPPGIRTANPGHDPRWDLPQEALRPVTAAEVAGQAGDDPDALLAALKTAAATNRVIAAAEVTRPGEQDLMEREWSVLRSFMHYVGRPPTEAEQNGPPDLSCDACVRLGPGTCDDHRRKPGEPIPAPPRPWPSEDPARYPGTYRINHPPPYNIYNSVR
jgi:hypothetical protein